MQRAGDRKERTNGVDLFGLLPDEMEALLRPLPRYRAAQIFRWIQRHRVFDPMGMTNLPADLKERLAPLVADLLPRDAAVPAESPDGSRKHLLRFPDGTNVEAVRIPGGKGVTICVSSQAGCRYDCAFCATPLGGFLRSLTAGEIVTQVLLSGGEVRRVVYMGMGEPLANYRNVVKSIRVLTHPEGLALAPRRITLSTVGLVPLIERLRREKLGVRLAISLVSAIPEKRARLMPVERRYPLASLLESAHRFAHSGGSPVTFEYVLLAGVNDGAEDAKALIGRLSPIPCKVNLIPFNRVETLPFEPPGEERIERFLAMLSPYLTVTVRRSAGSSIDAACGQLRLRRERAR
jgi:23S rRNA (adenine2503-C2)-methyltransferase